MRDPTRVPAAVVLSAVLLTGCTTAAADGDGTAESPLRVAVLAASSQNGYNQAVYQGVREGADDLGVHIEPKLLDGQFDSGTQLSQMQTAVASGLYDGIIVVPHDGPSLTAAFPVADGIPVVTVLNPIGPEIDTLEPQVEGVTSTVAVAPSTAAAAQADQLVDYCADRDPCRVVLLVGTLSSPLDIARRDAYTSVLGRHRNIEVVATAEGDYDRDTSLTAISNILQSHRDIDAVLSNADQQTLGAQFALESAGIDPSEVYLTGGGGTRDAIKAVRSGEWHADYINFPVSMGSAAFEQLHNALTGKDVKTVVDADKVRPGVEPYATAETLRESGDFVGEWNG